MTNNHVHIYTYGEFIVTDWPNLHVFDWVTKLQHTEWRATCTQTHKMQMVAAQAPLGLMRETQRCFKQFQPFNVMCHNYSGQSCILYGCLQKDLWVKLQKRSVPFCQSCFSNYTRLQQYNGNMPTLDKLYNIVPQGNFYLNSRSVSNYWQEPFFIINTKQTINHTYIYLQHNILLYTFFIIVLQTLSLHLVCDKIQIQISNDLFCKLRNQLNVVFIFLNTGLGVWPWL